MTDLDENSGRSALSIPVLFGGKDQLSMSVELLCLGVIIYGMVLNYFVLS